MVIRPKKNWQENITRGAKHFYGKHGYLPTQVPDTRVNEVMNKLKSIKKNA